MEGEVLLWDLLNHEGLLMEEIARRFGEKNASSRLGSGYVEEAHR